MCICNKSRRIITKYTLPTVFSCNLCKWYASKHMSGPSLSPIEIRSKHIGSLQLDFTCSIETKIKYYMHKVEGFLALLATNPFFWFLNWLLCGEGVNTTLFLLYINLQVFHFPKFFMSRTSNMTYIKGYEQYPWVGRHTKYDHNSCKSE